MQNASPWAAGPAGTGLFRAAFDHLVMLRSRFGVNDSGRTGWLGGNETIRISIDSEGFIPLSARRATASFSALDSRGRLHR